MCGMHAAQFHCMPKLEIYHQLQQSDIQRAGLTWIQWMRRHTDWQLLSCKVVWLSLMLLAAMIIVVEMSERCHIFGTVDTVCWYGKAMWVLAKCFHVDNVIIENIKCSLRGVDIVSQADCDSTYAKNSST